VNEGWGKAAFLISLPRMEPEHSGASAKVISSIGERSGSCMAECKEQ
jgi:hypothetical protein